MPRQKNPRQTKKAQLEAKKLEAQQNKETSLAAMKEKAEKAKAAATSAQKKVDPKAASLLAAKKTSGTISLEIFGFGAAKGKTKTGGPSGVPSNQAHIIINSYMYL